MAAKNSLPNHKLTLPTGTLGGFWDIPDPYTAFNYMVRQEPRIGMNLSKRKSLITSRGFDFEPCQDNPNSQDHIDYLKNFAFKKVNLSSYYSQLLNAIGFGFTAFWVVYEYEGSAPYVDSIKFIPRKAFFFESNTLTEEIMVKLNHFGGILANKDIREQYPYNLGWYIHEEDPDSDPRGLSALGRIYWYWRFLRHSLNLWEQFGERYAVPALFNELNTTETDPEKLESLLDASNTQLAMIRNAAVGTMNNGNIKILETRSGTDIFSNITDFCLNEIDMGTVGTNMLSTPKGGSFALAKETADMLLRQSLSDGDRAASFTQSFLIKPIIDAKFGEQDGYPSLPFNFANEATFEEILKSVVAGIPVSKNGFYELSGVPAPNDDNDILETNSNQSQNTTPSDDPVDDPADDPGDGENFSKINFSAKKKVEKLIDETDKITKPYEEKTRKKSEELAFEWADTDQPTEEKIQALEDPIFNVLFLAWLIGRIRANDQITGQVTKLKGKTINDLVSVVNIREEILFESAVSTNLYGAKLARIAAYDIRDKLNTAYNTYKVKDPVITKADWLKKMKKTGILSEAAINSKNPYYWETVFRTTAHTANMAALWEEVELNKDLIYALEYVAIEDERTTEICNSLDGTIAPYPSSFWDFYWPPNHFSCRSTPVVHSLAAQEVSPVQMSEIIPQPQLPKGFTGNPYTQWNRLPETTRQRARSYGILPQMNRRTREILSNIGDNLQSVLSGVSIGQ